MRKRLVAGNWKMHGSRPANRALVDAVRAGLRSAVGSAGTGVVICAPFPFLGDLSEQLRESAIDLGAQNASEHLSGAYTGEVSVSMLTEVGCRFVIVGHSERRQHYGETDAVVTAKFAAVQAGGLTPILCVGETLAERDAGQTEAVVGRQVDAVLARGGADSLSSAVLAYEPVWAIGTGRTATPEQAQAVHAFLRGRMAARNAGVADGLRILYGGSVKGTNAASIFAMPDVDGGLIGGASLAAEEFLQIIRAAS